MVSPGNFCSAGEFWGPSHFIAVKVGKTWPFRQKLHCKHQIWIWFVIWGPQMIVARVWFDPALTKKANEIRSGLHRRNMSDLDTDVVHWIYQIQTFLHKCWTHTKQEHIWNSCNDSYIPIATNLPQKSICHMCLCAYLWLSRCLYLHHKGEVWTSCVPRTPLHTWCRSPSPRMCSDTWLCSPSWPVWEGEKMYAQSSIIE